MACCKNASCSQSLPTAEMIDPRDIIELLANVASTGIKNFVFKDVAIDKLAEQISKLAAENNYLKRLTAFLSPLTASLIDDTVTISFGPANMYSLVVPVGTEEQRKSLAEQFQEIANNLNQTKEPNKQLNLFAK